MTKQVTVTGGNLFQVALDQYGDAMAWWQIGEASGISDPFIQGVATLTIPVYDPSDSDGVPPQQ